MRQESMFAGCLLEFYRQKTSYSIEATMKFAGYKGTDESLKNHYYQILRGERVPPLPRIYIWCQLFGVHPEEIFLPAFYTSRIMLMGKRGKAA